MLKTSGFKIQVNCPGCNTLHAVSGINNFESCRKCGKTIGLSSLFEETLFGNTIDKNRYVNGFLSGTVEQIGGGGVGRTGSYKLSYSSINVYCEECLTFIEETEIQNAVNEKRAVSCSACSHKMPLRLPDSDMTAFNPKAFCVVNDPQGFDAGKENTSAEKTLVFSCMTCGAGLNLTDKTERSIKCGYCNNENYLPDSIWLKLHPDEDVQPFFLITDLNETEIKESLDYFLNVTVMRVYQKHIDNFIDEMFQKIKMTSALNTWLRLLLGADFDDKIGYNMDIRKSQYYFYSRLSLGLASQNEDLKKTAAEFGKNMPEELQQKLTKDENENVRLALAENKFLSKEIYKILKSDSSPRVAEAASKHKTGLLSKLFG